MVEKSLSVKSKSLLRSSGVVSMMTMISRVLGFIRDLTIAQLFGAGAGIDAFFVAFKIPNFMRRLFAEGAFSQAFVPVLSEYQQTKSEDRLKRFMADMTGNLLLVLFLVTLIAVCSTPIIIKIFAPGFAHRGQRFIDASHMLKLTFPYLLFISMTALNGAILNTFGRFAVPSFTPVILNIVLIFAALYLSPQITHPVYALAFGVFIAGILQYLFQLPFLFHAGLLVRPRINFKDKGVRKVLKLMVPALFGVSVAQVNLLLDTIFASFLPVGSVSWLYYSDRLTFFPLGVFGVAIATVILPKLSREHAKKDNGSDCVALEWAMRMILIIAIPSTLGLIIFAKPILMTLLGYGKFTHHDVVMTQKSLSTFSLGLCAFMLVKVLGSAFYATQNIKTPVKVGAVSMLVNTVFCLLLIKPLAHAGLALASSIAGWVNALALLYLLIVRGVYQRASGWLKYLAQLLTANLLMAILLFYLKGHIPWVSLSGAYRGIYLLLSVLMALTLYFLSLYSSGLRLSHFRRL